MTAAIQSEPVESPQWLSFLTCFFARRLIRAGLWLNVILSGCTTSGLRHSVTRMGVAAGLLGVNLCATAAGAALGWLSKAFFRARRPGPAPGKYPATIHVCSTELHDAVRY